MAAVQFSGPWLPWFHGDFLRATQGWTVSERGVYFLLLGASWEMGPLPDDLRRLAGIVGAQMDEFEKAWSIVRPKFDLTESGFINRRLEIHREKQALRSEKARQSAAARWTGSDPENADASANGHANAYASGDAGRDAQTHANTMLEGMRSGCSSELRSQNSKKGKSTKTARAIARAAAVDVPPFHQQVIDLYLEICPDSPRIARWTQERRDLLDARIAERVADGKPANTIDYWRSVFRKVADSDWLSGRTKDPFTGANIQWLLEPTHFLKLVEGGYNGRRSTNGVHAHG